eukprot:Lithocolla_globosa_v1_NODE_34_length_8743_cov_33.461096.p2 type:complete len:107 gc:universal NODE_34_length_8743_cov_33.461096:3375-3055(-)
MCSKRPLKNKTKPTGVVTNRLLPLWLMHWPKNCLLFLMMKLALLTCPICRRSLKNKSLIWRLTMLMWQFCRRYTMNKPFPHTPSLKKAGKKKKATTRLKWIITLSL